MSLDHILRALKFASGATITEASIDGTLAGNSDAAVPTEKAVKTYVDTAVAGGITGPENVMMVPMSFETGEQTTYRLYFPMKVTINKIRSEVVKALADTDAGTITCGNSTGASAGGVATHAASAALADRQTATPTTNNVVLADGYYYLTSAKTTVGGKVLVTLEFTLTA